VKKLINWHFFLKQDIKYYGEFSFYLGTFFLASALPLSGIFLLLSIFLSILDTRYISLKDNWNKFLLLISGFFLINTLHFYFSTLDEKLYGFDKSISILSLFNWLPLFLIFFSFQKYLDNENKRRNFAKSLTAGLIPVLISCVMQYWFRIYGPKEILNGLIVWFNKPLFINEFNKLVGNGGVSGLFSNQNYTGFWLSVTLPFTFALFNYYKNFNYKKFILILILCISVYFLFLTNSRNAILGFLTSSVIVFGVKNLILLLFLISIFLLLLNLLGSFLPFFDFNITEYIFKSRVLLKFFQINTVDLLAITRVKIWTNTLKMIIEKPLFGFGASTFPLIYNYIDPFPAQHAHNMPLQIAFEYGLPLSILLTTFITLLFYKTWCTSFLTKNKSSLANKCWIAASFAAIIHHLLDITYYDGKISILIWILLCGLKCILDDSNNESKVLI
tara:strand:+ start:2043 stop:3377 length:1335 start_codon:yes stop_codon:yes gene_type:complete